MARSTKATKKSEAIEFEFNGENGNSFSGRIFEKSSSTQNADCYPLSIVINGLAIKGCKLVDGVKGSFVSMPSYKDRNGEYQSQCYFFNKDDMKDLSDLSKHLVELIVKNNS